MLERFYTTDWQKATHFPKTSRTGKGLLTHDEVQFGVSLEGIVQCDKEREVPDGLQHTTLSECVFHYLLLAYNGCLLKDLHGEQLSPPLATHFPYKEHLSVTCSGGVMWVTSEINTNLAVPTSCTQHTEKFKVLWPHPLVGICIQEIQQQS